MKTLIEESVLRQALENVITKIPWSDRSFTNEAITALRSALDAAEKGKEQLAAVTKQRDELVEWVCHNGGLLNEWAKDWNPAKHPPLTKYIRGRLIHALAKLGVDKTGDGS